MRVGPVMDGYPLIVAAAEQLAPSDPELAVVMLAEAVQGCFYAGDTRGDGGGGRAGRGARRGPERLARDVLRRDGERDGAGGGRAG